MQTLTHTHTHTLTLRFCMQTQTITMDEILSLSVFKISWYHKIHSSNFFHLELSFYPPNLMKQKYTIHPRLHHHHRQQQQRRKSTTCVCINRTKEDGNTTQKGPATYSPVCVLHICCKEVISLLRFCSCFCM